MIFFAHYTWVRPKRLIRIIQKHAQSTQEVRISRTRSNLYILIRGMLISPNAYRPVLATLVSSPNMIRQTSHPNKLSLVSTYMTSVFSPYKNWRLAVGRCGDITEKRYFSGGLSESRPPPTKLRQLYAPIQLYTIANNTTIHLVPHSKQLDE